MRKLKLRLEDGKTLRLKSLTGPTEALIKLLRIEVTAHRAAWEISVNDKIIVGVYGIQQPLNSLWPGSWITLSGPVTLHIGVGKFRPEFIVCVPNHVVLDQTEGK